MTMKPKARRFRLQRSDAAGADLQPSVASVASVIPDERAARRAGGARASAATPGGTGAAPAGGAGASPGSPITRVRVLSRAESQDAQHADGVTAPKPAPERSAAVEAGRQAEAMARQGAKPSGTGAMLAAARTRSADAAGTPARADDGPAPSAQPAATGRDKRATAPRGPEHHGEHGADSEGSPEALAQIEAIRAEGYTARQLRMAMRVARRRGLRASSGLEALHLLRKRGIDPFARPTTLEGTGTAAKDEQPDPPSGDESGPKPSSSEPVHAKTAGTAGAERKATRGSAREAAHEDARDGVQSEGSASSRALTTTTQPPLPRTTRQPAPPATAEPDAAARTAAKRNAEIARIQRDIVSRRRRRVTLLLARLAVFVLLPTLLAGWYFYRIATPLYATQTEFVIQQADAAAAGGAPGLGGLFSGTGLATSQDSVTVQSFLQSREAMRRLIAEEGFRAHFQDPSIDPLRRLGADASDEQTYRLYRRHVQISYDPTEGVVRMEVIAADPETSERFARALIGYAEEQVDNLTQRLRENQMRDAEASFERAEERMVAAQMRVLELQESFQVLSSEVEVTLLTQQIATLEGQLNQERLTLEDLLSNPRPNAARVAQAERRIAALEAQVTALRRSLTDGGEGGASVARVQRELTMAEADVQTRQMMLAQSLQQLEAARIEAARQVRYLSMGVSPVAPDEATYPRRFENTALAFLIFAGIYLLISMTASVLREQVTS